MEGRFREGYTKDTAGELCGVVTAFLDDHHSADWLLESTAVIVDGGEMLRYDYPRRCSAGVAAHPGGDSSGHGQSRLRLSVGWGDGFFAVVKSNPRGQHPGGLTLILV